MDALLGRGTVGRVHLPVQYFRGILISVVLEGGPRYGRTRGGGIRADPSSSWWAHARHYRGF